MLRRKHGFRKDFIKMWQYGVISTKSLYVDIPNIILNFQIKALKPAKVWLEIASS